MPILSIIVPTHERARYAEKTVVGILDSTRETEVIVCDTSAGDHWHALQSRLGDDSRLRIVRPGKPLSVVGNFNTALAYATGDYVCFIGDDDLVAPDIEQIAFWAREQALDTVGFTFPVVYYWPDYLHRSLPELYAGTLWLSPFTGSVKSVDTRSELRAATAQPGLGVLDMPRAYCGLVSRDTIQRTRDKFGDLFGGVSPDIYSAALLASEAGNSVRLDYPGVIPGASGSSTAGQSAAGKHVGGLRDNAHIGAFTDLVWDPLIPEFYSVPTVWSFSLLKAVERINSDQAAHMRLNFGRLYARCLIFHPRYRDKTMAAMAVYVSQASVWRLAWGLGAGVVAEALWIARKLASRLKPVKRGGERIAGVGDSAEAGRTLAGVLDRRSGPPPIWASK